MNAFERLERLAQRIAELRAGVEVDAKHINVLLSPAQQREFDMEWRRQQTLRNSLVSQLLVQALLLSATSMLCNLQKF